MNAEDIWQSTLSILETQLSKPSFETWILQADPITVQENTLILSVPNDFTKNWLEARYAELIESCIRDASGQQLRVKFILPNQDILEQIKRETAASQLQVDSDDEDMTFQLNPKYTFSTFVIGDSNRFAHAATLAVAEAPAKAYNPLFIYGRAGLGKTHLMHALGHYVREHHQHLKIVYVSSEKFINEFINSIRDETTIEFRNKYRNVDILLVDDIQFLAGKDRTQIEFFHTFNALYEAKKQIVISSDRPPKEIPTLEDRLRSRFEWGLITDIQPPDLETRVAILQKKCKQENIHIVDEVHFFIAENIKSNIRELEGALTRVIAYASFNNKPITLELAKDVLQDIIPQKTQKPITIPLIQETVAQQFGLSVKDLMSRRRTKAISYPRQIAMYLSRKLTDSSLPKIGEEFGGRDHTTVLHAHDKIESELKKNKELARMLEDLVERIKSQ